MATPCRGCGVYLPHPEKLCAKCVQKDIERGNGPYAVYGTRLALIRESKDKPCMDCGKTYGYWVMQFDHREPKLKEFNIAAWNKHNLEDIRIEIAKCDVVCANCHMDRTHMRREKRPKDFKYIPNQPNSLGWDCYETSDETTEALQNGKIVRQYH